MKKLIEAFKRWWKKHVCDDAPEGYDIDADVVRGCNCAPCRIDGYTPHAGKMPPPPPPGPPARTFNAWGSEIDHVWLDELADVPPVKMPLASDVQQDPVTKAWHGRVDNKPTYVGHMHLEQVPDGSLGEYLAAIEQHPRNVPLEDLPPMRNANRKFAFCFMLTYKNGDRLITDDTAKVQAWNVARCDVLFLNAGFETQLAVGYRYRWCADCRWQYAMGKPADHDMQCIANELLYL